MKSLGIVCIKIYRKIISPLIPARCIYYPTCSEYSLQALQKYGFIKGGYKTIKRLVRCHPFNSGGYDPLD